VARYVIMQNNNEINKIVGYGPGSLEAVRLAAEDLVVRAKMAPCGSRTSTPH